MLLERILSGVTQASGFKSGVNFRVAEAVRVCVACCHARISIGTRTQCGRYRECIDWLLTTHMPRLVLILKETGVPGRFARIGAASDLIVSWMRAYRADVWSSFDEIASVAASANPHVVGNWRCIHGM